jgi:hypothetical protein
MRQRRTFHTKKGEIHQKEIIIINLYAPNDDPTSSNILKDLKTYINSNTVVIGDFNT